MTQIAIARGVGTYSASQVKQYRACEMKWYLSHVLGYRQPPTTSLEVGKSAHKGVEDLLAGEPTDDHLGQRLYDNLAAHVDLTTHAAELRFEVNVWPADAGYPPTMLGYIDVVTPTHVVDHKTTSGLGWALTAYQLRHDVQMMTYAYVHLRATRAPAVTIAHNVIETGTARTRWTETAVDMCAAERYWIDIIQPTVRRMEASRWEQELNPRTGEETGECDRYGGCHVRAQCAAGKLTQIRPKAEVDKETEESHMGVKENLDALKARIAAQRAGNVAPEPKSDVSPRRSNEVTCPKCRTLLRVYDAGLDISKDP